MIMSSNTFRFAFVLAAVCNAVTWATDEVNLGTAENYAILTKSGISTVPSSAITGDIAVSPIAATALTGFSLTKHSGGTYWTSTQVTGQAFAADGATPTPTILTTAISDMEIAYADAKGRSAEVENGFSNIGAPVGTIGSVGFGDATTPLQPGVYTFTVDLTIGSDLFLEGGPDDVFIIRTTGSLVQIKNTNVVLVTQSDGTTSALAKNIIWQVAGNVVVGAGAHMKGIILSKTDILFITGSSLDGRALAQTACDLQKATVVQPAE